MRKKEICKLALRVLYYENRVAVEFFHALTDGSGAMVFLKTLAAIYLEERYGAVFYGSEGVLCPGDTPDEEELEDAFQRYAGPTAAKREMPYAFRLTGTPEPDGFLHVTRGTVSCAQILAAAKEKGVSLTTYLSAALCLCLEKIQKRRVAPQKEKAVRVQIPVNLRKHFPSRTLRNFVAVYNVGMEKGETDAEFDEILSRIHHQMALMNTPRNLRAVFTANVNSEKGMAIRLVPLFLKNIVMRAVFDRVGESLACLCLSNLGVVRLPDGMAEYVTGFDFIIGPQAKAPYNCGVVSYGDDLRIHLVRNTVQPELEKEFFSFLSSRGLDVTLESNER
ncbi:MAG: alcohol acetyltransferase [Clostridia bacterium]|nr:alcohol acetyltransferase [Clostridia bacterium]